MRLRQFTFLLFFLIISLTSWGQTPGQVNALNQKKFNVYKSDIKGDVVKDGIKGVSVLFSVEYNLSDDEYAQLGKNGQNYFTFFVTILDKNNEPVYDAFQYANYRTRQTTANHFATTIAYGSKVKTAKPEPRRSTGIELFIPYAHLNLPEGPNPLKVVFSTYAGNSDAPGKRFDNFANLPTTINKPATYWVKLTPKQLFVTDKSGKRTEVTQIAEDFAVKRGVDKAAADLLSAGKVVVGMPTSFIYSEGDAVSLKTQRAAGTTGQLANRLRPVKTMSGQTLTGFEGGITAEWPLDLKADKALSLKNNPLEVNMALEKVRVPQVRLAGFKINRYVKHEGVTGASITFNYEATVAKNLPDLLAVPTYSLSDDGKGPFGEIGRMKVISGNATADTSGAIILSRSGAGTAEVFFPYASFLLEDDKTRQKSPKLFFLDVRLQGSPTPLAQKTAKQGLEVNTLKDANVSSPTINKDVVFNNARGASITIPYQIPPMYAEFDGTFTIQFSEAVEKGQQPRLLELLRKTTVMDENTKKITGTEEAAKFQVNKPTGNIVLFMPYATLALTENAPMKFASKVFIQKAPAAPLELGNSLGSVKLGLDETKLRFLTVGVSGVKMKNTLAESLFWRIRSTNGIIYQSPGLKTDKKMENFYTHPYCAHEDDKVLVEVLTGTDVNNLKEVAKWEMPVKSLKPTETAELISGEGDGNFKSITVTYRVN